MNSATGWKTGLALFVLCVGAAVAAPAQTFTLLNSLSDTYGGYPGASLVQGIDGNLYGTGFYGGTYDKNFDSGLGTAFQSTLTGQLSLMHDFTISQGTNPSGLTLALNGNLYGTTNSPGPNSCDGCGTVFGFTSQGTIFILHSFSGTDGAYPQGLTLGPDGNLYGVTQAGGANGYGSVYKISPTGTFTSLHSFNNTTDGNGPAGPLVLGATGNFYGMTVAGGSSGDGTVFMITSEGALTTLHNFSGADGSAPIGSMAQAVDGNFYGATRAGGKSGAGTVFLISPGGHTFQHLYSFAGNSGGGFPGSGLVLGSDGNFYGTLMGDGVDNEYGSLFELTPSGVVTTLHTFDGTDGGNYPTLMQDTNGTFYGTTLQFGANDNCPPIDGCGTIFSLSNGLGPFITTVPQMRGIGAKVLILGQGLTGATSVTFNGVAAEFTVNSDTEITATVPARATKGIVTVTTPSGTLSTTVLFYIG